MHDMHADLHGELASSTIVHVTAKHPEFEKTPEKCFVELANFDPSDPKGEKAAAKAKADEHKKKSKAKKELSSKIEGSERQNDSINSSI